MFTLCTCDGSDQTTELFDLTCECPPLPLQDSATGTTARGRGEHQMPEVRAVECLHQETVVSVLGVLMVQILYYESAGPFEFLGKTEPPTRSASAAR